MYKIFAFLFGLIVLNKVSAQDKNLDSIAVPIFSGCEKQSSREDQFFCLQKNITNLYSSQLQNYIYAFEYLNVASAEAEVQFVVRKDGDLNLKYIDTPHPLFRSYNVLSFQDMKAYMEKNKLGISLQNTSAERPATDLILKFPIYIKLNETVDETENRLIHVFYDGEVKYEVVMTPEKDFKMYEIKGDRSFYLGKYNSLLEIKNTLPYKNLIRDPKELVSLVQSDYGSSKIVLQTRNIFYERDFYTLFIVSEIKGKRIKQLRKYTTLKSFKDSPYYDWLIRK